MLGFYFPYKDIWHNINFNNSQSFCCWVVFISWYDKLIIVTELEFYLVHPQHLKQKLEAHLHQRRLISVVKFSPRAERTASVLHQSPTYRTLILRKILPFLTRKRCLKRSKVPIRNLLKWWTTKNHRSTGVTRTCFSPLLLYINKSKCQNLYPQIVLLWLVSNLQYLKFLTNTWLVHYIFDTFRYLYILPSDRQWAMIVPNWIQFWWNNLDFFFYLTRFWIGSPQYNLWVEEKVIWGSREVRV